MRQIFLVLLVTLASFHSVFAEERLEEMWRSNNFFEIRVQGTDLDDPGYRCLDSGISINKDRSTVSTIKSRILCDTPWGRFAHFWAFDRASSGESVIVLIDVDSGVWLKLVDQPEIEPRGEDEDRWAWQGRLDEVRNHLVSVETSARLFDPFDAEVAMEARSVLWEDLQKSDPDLAEIVILLLEDLGACRHPWCEALTGSLGKWVYAGEPLRSPEVVVRRVAGGGVVDPKEHELFDFEKDFGKWGDSFPDPPKLN